jgi:hypothetical protein
MQPLRSIKRRAHTPCEEIAKIASGAGHPAARRADAGPQKGAMTDG